MRRTHKGEDGSVLHGVCLHDFRASACFVIKRRVSRRFPGLRRWAFRYCTAGGGNSRRAKMFGPPNEA